MRIKILFHVGLLTLWIPSVNHAFSFSEEEEKEKANAAKAASAAARRTQQLLSVPCAPALKNKTIAVVIGEYGNYGRIRTLDSQYGMHFQIINNRLQRLGLRTLTQAQITARIAREEVEAVLNNDPDAALSAAERLGAAFILTGVIRARSNYNPLARVKEVYVDMGFSLSDASGRLISDASAGGDSWAGGDMLSVSLDLVREQAETIVARLYHDYCTRQ